MKRAIRKLRACLLLALLVSMIVPAASGHAITARQKALNAYKTMLSKSKVDIYGNGRYYKAYNGTAEAPGKTYRPTASSKVQFATAYINNDTIPELIVRTKTTSRQYLWAIYTYKNGRVVKVTTGGDYTEVLLGYYQRTGLFKRKYTKGFTWEYHNKINGTKAYPFASKLTYRSSGKSCHKYYIYVDGVRRDKSYSAYCSAFKKAISGKPFKRFNYHQNSAANRKKYL
jgi:hypothetical protein